jgi:hypothetical protein
MIVATVAVINYFFAQKIFEFKRGILQQEKWTQSAISYWMNATVKYGQEGESESKPQKEHDHRYTCPTKHEPTGASCNGFHQFVQISRTSSLSHQASKDSRVYPSPH